MLVAAASVEVEAQACEDLRDRCRCLVGDWVRSGAGKGIGKERRCACWRGGWWGYDSVARVRIRYRTPDFLLSILSWMVGGMPLQLLLYPVALIMHAGPDPMVGAIAACYVY